MESKHPETYFNKLKLRIKLVKLNSSWKILCIYFRIHTCEQAILERYTSPKAILHPNIGLYHRSYRSSLLIVQWSRLPSRATSCYSHDSLPETYGRWRKSCQKLSNPGMLHFHLHDVFLAWPSQNFVKQQSFRTQFPESSLFFWLPRDNIIVELPS
jgi:hypothetical protein